MSLLRARAEASEKELAEATRNAELLEVEVRALRDECAASSDEQARLQRDVVALVSHNRELRLRNQELFGDKCAQEELRMVSEARVAQLEVDIDAAAARYEAIKRRFVEGQVEIEERAMAAHLGSM
jgi:hypothetical protein